MYTTTFIISAVNIRIPITGRVAENNIQFDVALVSMMTVLTGILAPKLLLSIRKEFYGIAETDSSAAEQRPITSRVVVSEYVFAKVCFVLSIEATAIEITVLFSPGI